MIPADPDESNSFRTATSWFPCETRGCPCGTSPCPCGITRERHAVWARALAQLAAGVTESTLAALCVIEFIYLGELHMLNGLNN